MIDAVMIDHEYSGLISNVALCWVGFGPVSVLPETSHGKQEVSKRIASPIFFLESSQCNTNNDLNGETSCFEKLLGLH